MEVLVQCTNSMSSDRGGHEPLNDPFADEVQEQTIDGALGVLVWSGREFESLWLV